MTDQQQHRATDEQWAKQHYFATNHIDTASPCILELRHRVEALEALDHHPLLAAVRAQCKTVAHLSNRVERLEDLHAAVVDLNQRFDLDPLIARIKALEASGEKLPTYRESCDAVAAHRRAVDQLHSYKVGPAEPVEDWGQGHTLANTPDPAAGAQVGQSSAAVDQMLALQDQIRDGSLTLAESLKEFYGEPEPAADAQPLTLLKQVAGAIDQTPYGRDGCQDSEAEARATIRAIAAWLRRECDGLVGVMMARMLDNEANR